MNEAFEYYASKIPDFRHHGIVMSDFHHTNYGGYCFLRYSEKLYCSIFLNEQFRKQGLYEELYKAFKCPVLTLEACNLTEFLTYKNIEHIVLPNISE